MSSPAYMESKSNLFSDILLCTLLVFVLIVFIYYNGVICLFASFTPKRISVEESKPPKFVENSFSHTCLGCVLHFFEINCAKSHITTL